MSKFRAIKRVIQRVIHGKEPLNDRLYECILRYVDIASSRFLGKSTALCKKRYAKRMHRELFHISDSSYHIKNARLPILPPELEEPFFYNVFDDTFYSYLYMDDKYDAEIFRICDKFLLEGLYGLVNDKVNVTVEPDDVVLDVGSWIGDFAAYSSAKGAVTYAFEPSRKYFSLLEQTAALNQKIIPVMKALSASEEKGSKINGVFGVEQDEYFDITTIDAFVRENNLPRVDFIKADIEGNERRMLAGAQDTLARFAPKLALCTYHLPDDPQVMAELILKANPKYNIVQKRMKLFASVPE